MPATSWLREQARALRAWGHSVRDTARILGVPRSTVADWTRPDTRIPGLSGRTPIRTPSRAESGHPPKSAVKPSGQVEGLSSGPSRASAVSPGVIRGTFAGSHNWHWTAPIESPGRDVLLENRKSLSGSLVWWTRGIDYQGLRLTVERHLPNKGGHGSLVVRYRLDAAEGEDPEAHHQRACRVVEDYLDHLRATRGIQTSRARLSQKPHFTVRGDSVAHRVGQVMRVKVRDAYGWVWVDYSHHPGGGWIRGDREASGDTPETLHKSTEAYLRLDGNLQATLEQLPGIREQLAALPEVVGALKELAGEIRGVREPVGPRPPPPPGPEVG